MNIFIIGDTTSTQYLAKRLASEEGVTAVYHAWSHSTTPQQGKYFPIYPPDNISDMQDPLRVDALLDQIATLEIDLLIVAQLTFMFSDRLRECARKHNIATLYPHKEWVRLEWSRYIFQLLIKDTNIPFPLSRDCFGAQARDVFKSLPLPFVLKYDKMWMDGEQTKVVTKENYNEVFDDINKKEHDNTKFFFQSFIEGTEYSYHALVSTSGWRFLGAARDYKKKFDNDRGPNTNGMGAYGPVTVDPVVHTYIDTLVNKMKALGKPYVGFIYLGIITGKDGIPVVLEMNVRPGCPEIQTILPSIDNNLATLFMAAAKGEPMEYIRFNDNKTVNVVVSDHDPVDTRYCVSVDRQRNSYNVTSSSVAAAADEIYGIVDQLDTSKVYYRTDIGYLP